MKNNYKCIPALVCILWMVSITGCRIQPVLDELKITLSPKNWFSEQKSCVFGSPGACTAERVCAYVEPGRAECVKRYVGSTPLIRFPFAPDTEVSCVQGAETKTGDHNFENSLYAIDLATTDPAAKPATVYASIDGTAFVYRSCPDGVAGSENCGAGFGNHVRILNTDGLMVLYANLGSVFVEDGQPVKIGHPIGREGRSGRAARRQLHFSVHHTPVEPWLDMVAKYRGQAGHVPPSIPFETQFCDPARKDNCYRTRSRVEKIPCDSKVPVGLIADWRD